MVKERDFKRRELLEKFITKILYKWKDEKFEEKYLRKLKRNWNKWKNNRKEEKEKRKYENKNMEELREIVWI